LFAASSPWDISRPQETPARGTKRVFLEPSEAISMLPPG